MDLLPRRQRHQYLLAGGVAISQPGGLGNVTIAPLVRGRAGAGGAVAVGGALEGGWQGRSTDLSQTSCPGTFPVHLCSNCQSWTFKR
jgi:hypothetical protein